MDINYLLDYWKLDEIHIKKAFGKSLKELRKHCNITQQALAEEVLIANQSISVYERGESAPTIAQALRITHYFGLTIDDFIIYGLGAQKAFNFDDFEDITAKYDYENK